ncbi:MAG: deaminase [Proteobacteria bacterium]|nr:deaminase [Pseudomonadota bacterium]
MQTIKTAEAPAAIGPYAQAIEVDGWIFTSGQIPLSADGDLLTGDIASQTRQVLANLQAVLEAAGASLQAVVKTTVFLTHLEDFKSMNEVYAAAFGSHTPARSTVQVAALPRGAAVEIEVVARKPR